MTINIGIDLGGTKILGSALTSDGETLLSIRKDTPRFDYKATIATICEIVCSIEQQLNTGSNVSPSSIQPPTYSVGICIPGSVCPSTGLIQNANSTWLNDKCFYEDLCSALKRDVRLENDANCFALSESADGAAKDACSVFGVILGTGVGGGLILDDKIINGPRSSGGEWGHCSLPFPDGIETANAQKCWCGQKGCIESWISGPALLLHHNLVNPGDCKSAQDVVALANVGNESALDSLEAHAHRTARALSMVVNIFDPEVIVLGGGLSELDHFYDQLPDLMKPYIFTSEPFIDIRPPQHGATSGVRGAARLWGFENLS